MLEHSFFGLIGALQFYFAELSLILCVKKIREYYLGKWSEFLGVVAVNEVQASSVYFKRSLITGLACGSTGK